ncbi:ABC transporter substrate-binding protein [Parvibaculaceae bacterium PLY_AMNH_Bact1]|nr:ABC transporter substrate-binding protein [Parvibaculaceae bacterium PLY_AMNH_Bact1]
MTWQLWQSPSPARRSFIVGLVLLASIAFVAMPASAARDEPAEAFVNDIASEAIEILGREGFTPEELEASFRTLFVGNMDVPRIGLFALGQYARTPTSEQKTEYLALVEEFIVKVYASRLSDYTDQQFAVLSSQPKGSRGKEVIVASQIEFTTGRAPVPVEWWLLKTDDGFKVFDVKVLGIWMAQEQRSTFISVIRNNGGNFSSLLEHIETQIAQANQDRDVKVTEADTAVATETTQ